MPPVYAIRRATAVASLGGPGGYSATVVTSQLEAAPPPRLVLRLVAAEAVTRVGDAITLLALPLTAVLVLDASPIQLAFIGAAQALPILLLTLPAGAWVDGRPRRWPIIVAADLARALLIASVPIAAVSGFLSIPMLALVALLVSACGTCFDLAFASWIPRLVSGDALHRTNARLELARSAAAATGPVLGGFLVGLLSAPMALIGDALSVVASAAFVTSVLQGEPRTSTSSPATGRSQLLAGTRFVARQPIVRAITLTAGVNNLTRAIAMSIAVLYLVEVAGMSAPAIGLAFAIGSTGFVVGALVSRPLTHRIGMGPTMQLGVGLFGPSMLLFALSPPELAGPMFSAMSFAHGFGIAVHNVNQVTLRQILTPDALRARVAAVFRLVIFGAIPVGTVVGGILGELVGLQAALFASGIGLLFGSLPYALLRVVRIRTLDQLSVASGA
jgi:MFS family permease